MNNTMDIVTEYGIGPDFFEYIESHKSCDTAKLLLASKKPGPAFDLKFAILQIECRKRISRKVPELAGMPHFIPFLCRFQSVGIVFPLATVCFSVHLDCQSHRFLSVLIGKAGVVLNIRKHRLV